MSRFAGHSKRYTTENLRYIDTKLLNEWDYFSGHTGGTVSWTSSVSGAVNLVSIDVSVINNPYIKFDYIYKQGESNEVISFKTKLISSKCYYGGQRWWIQCPLIHEGAPCENKVRKLYSYGKYFGCRDCLNLCYSSQNQDRRSRWFHLDRTIDAIMMADDILQSISKKTYRGVWTKKYRKYMNLKFKSINSWKSWEGLDASLDD